MPNIGDKMAVQPFGTEFRVKDEMSDTDVGTMLKKAFPLLEKNNEAMTFFNDLCRIGGFMTRRTQVEKALKPLSDLLRDTLSDTNTPHRAKIGFETFVQDRKHTTTENRHKEPVIFKTYKLLSGALRNFEAKANFGFEGMTPVDYQLLDKFAIASDLENFASSKTWDSKGVPTGVPVMSGTVAASWNQVILKQGYQVKDPGAGMAHGEYTHRLQWNAIMNANLQLEHKPVEIYRALGSPWAGHFLDKEYKKYMEGNEEKVGWRRADKSRSYYIWGMIFDAQEAETGFEGKMSPSPNVQRGPHLPKSMNYTCPEILNAELGGSSSYISKMNTKDPLFALKVLNHVRFMKRGIPEGRTGAAHNPIIRFEGQTTKKVTHALLDGTGENFANIIWYVTETK